MRRVINNLALPAMALLALLPFLASKPALSHTSDTTLVNATLTGMAGIGRDFEFLDGNGKLRRLSDFKGNVVAVFFGFTSCPDVCPGFLAKAKTVADTLPEDEAERFKVVFVTIDPKRDTRVTLNYYLQLFDRDFYSARIPGESELERLVADFSIASQIAHDVGGNVSISHSAGAFLIDTNSEVDSYVSGSKNTFDLLASVKGLLAQQ